MGDLLSQTSKVLEEASWYPRIVANHISADTKYKASRAKMQERAAIEIEALTKEPK